EDGQARVILPLYVAQFVPDRRLERIEQRLGAERRAADAEHQDVVVRLAHPVGKAADPADHVGLRTERHEAVLALAPPAVDVRLDGRKALAQFLEPGSAQAVLPVELVGQHPSVVQLHAAISSVSPSYPGWMPSGSDSASFACP